MTHILTNRIRSRILPPPTATSFKSPPPSSTSWCYSLRLPGTSSSRNHRDDGRRSQQQLPRTHSTFSFQDRSINHDDDSSWSKSAHSPTTTSSGNLKRFQSQTLLSPSGRTKWSQSSLKLVTNESDSFRSDIEKETFLPQAKKIVPIQDDQEDAESTVVPDSTSSPKQSLETLQRALDHVLPSCSAFVQTHAKTGSDYLELRSFIQHHLDSRFNRLRSLFGLDPPSMESLTGQLEVKLQELLDSLDSQKPISDPSMTDSCFSEASDTSNATLCLSLLQRLIAARSSTAKLSPDNSSTTTSLEESVSLSNGQREDC